MKKKIIIEVARIVSSLLAFWLASQHVPLNPIS